MTLLVFFFCLRSCCAGPGEDAPGRFERCLIQLVREMDEQIELLEKARRQSEILLSILIEGVEADGLSKTNEKPVRNSVNIGPFLVDRLIEKSERGFSRDPDVRVLNRVEAARCATDNSKESEQ